MQEIYLIMVSTGSIFLIFIFASIVGWATDSAESGMKIAVGLGFIGIHIFIYKAGWGWLLFIELTLVVGYGLFKLVDKYEGEIDAWWEQAKANLERKKKVEEHKKDVKEIRNMFDDL